MAIGLYHPGLAALLIHLNSEIISSNAAAQQTISAPLDPPPSGNARHEPIMVSRRALYERDFRRRDRPSYRDLDKHARKRFR